LNPTQLLKAIAFAADKHRHQRRKDAEASPYINHPIAVATVLAAEGDVSDEVTLIAAALHDTVEDTQTTFIELEKHFGPEVAGLVRELTDSSLRTPCVSPHAFKPARGRRRSGFGCSSAIAARRPQNNAWNLQSRCREFTARRG
jgi:HD domain